MAAKGNIFLHSHIPIFAFIHERWICFCMCMCNRVVVLFYSEKSLNFLFTFRSQGKKICQFFCVLDTLGSESELPFPSSPLPCRTSQSFPTCPFLTYIVAGMILFCQHHVKIIDCTSQLLAARGARWKQTLWVGFPGNL